MISNNNGYISRKKKYILRKRKDVFRITREKITPVFGQRVVFFFVVLPATSDAKDKPKYLRNTSSISPQFIPSLSAINLSISATKATVGD